MKKFQNLYISATSQHVGKTTSTLGLVSSYIKQGLNVGYCKPVGQKVLDFNDMKVDKDTVLFADLIHFDIKPGIHSPVVLGKGATEKVLEEPNLFNFPKRIRHANKILSSQHELTIYEGTGHPGVGSIAGLSNAKVAKLVDAKTVMVVEGGIGSTIDMLNMCMALFREEKVKIIGVIINKVIPEKRDKVEYFVKKWLTSKKIDLCGIIPYEQTLAYPLIRTISETIEGTIEYGDAYKDNYVSNILAGSLIDLSELKSNENLLLLVDARSLSAAINRIKWLTDLYNIDHCPLSGVVITGHGPVDQKTKKYIRENNLPVIRTDLDTYGAVIRISKIEVKINKNTPWKVDKAIDLIEQNVDLQMILDKCRL
jgi:BioD-like phosphotransacetylase family protein